MQVTNLGNVLRHRFGKSFSEDGKTLCLFLGHRFGKCLGHGYGKRFSPYEDGLLKMISVSSMKVFLGNEFGKCEALRILDRDEEVKGAEDIEHCSRTEFLLFLYTLFYLYGLSERFHGGELSKRGFLKRELSK